MSVGVVRQSTGRTYQVHGCFVLMHPPLFDLLGPGLFLPEREVHIRNTKALLSKTNGVPLWKGWRRGRYLGGAQPFLQHDRDRGNPVFQIEDSHCWRWFITLIWGTMDVNVQFMTDSAKRRRDQNRLAQRKFRGESSVSSKLCRSFRWSGLCWQRRSGGRRTMLL